MPSQGVSGPLLGNDAIGATVRQTVFSVCAPCTNYNEEPAMFVANYGAKGGLTVGLGNTLKSIVGENDTLEGHMEGYSEEWAITSVG